ncbi:unnamed protein product [Oreochromis niloticus]|nr:unnamed protein product [Mustela putorius furo]
MKSMEQFLIIVLVAGGIHAHVSVDETTCDLTKSTCPCSPLLKGTVYIRVMTDASGREMKCLKVLAKNGTLKITNVRRNDSGHYSIEVFNSNGVQEKNIHFTLDVKALVPVDETTCDLRTSTCPCSPFLEGTVYIQVMNDARGCEMKCLKVLPKNGTLKITNVRRNDSGQYSIEVFNSNGVQEKNIHFTLDVKDNGNVEGMGTYCDGSQDGTKCYGALGRTLDIHLGSISEILEYQLLKDSLKIFSVKKNIISSKTTEHRYLFLSNGTFRINNLSRSDSDNYTLQTFDSDGRRSDERILQLFIQAPVSSVLLVSECLSQGDMRVSCSSEGGDSPQYSWTLDGRTLTDAELLSVNNESNIITLKQHVSGRLVCSVRNNVSNVSKEERISTCGAGILPLMGGVLSALIIFLVVGVAVKKKQKNPQTYKTGRKKMTRQ